MELAEILMVVVGAAGTGILCYIIWIILGIL
jgi:phage shock protein PspC (stress-responsive transcriptional regulator)